jgi:hypothetical protein
VKVPRNLSSDTLIQLLTRFGYTAIPNSKRVYAVSDDRVSSIDLNFNDRAMVPASKISEFGIAVGYINTRQTGSYIRLTTQE